MKKVYILLIILFSIEYIYAQKLFTSWTTGTSPVEVGKKLTEKFIISPHGNHGSNATPYIPYPEVCTWYGALKYANLTKDTSLIKKLIERFEPLWNKDSSLLPYPNHVDYTVFGAIPLEIYLQTKDEKYLFLGKKYADTQWAKPFGKRVTEESNKFYNTGYSFQTRLWIDDMYMITLVQLQAYKVTKDEKYIERAAKEMVLYLDSLQKPNGLFYHAKNSPFYWGRGNGWMAAGMTELLSSLPKKNIYYNHIMQGYKTMMRSLLQYQSKNGMWRQLVNDSTSWEESSSTGMFTYAMITGVKKGWLNKNKFGNAAQKAWLALVSHINNNANVTDICEGTNAGNSREYYLNRKKLTGDFHGQAPVLWCANAFLSQ